MKLIILTCALWLLVGVLFWRALEIIERQEVYKAAHCVYIDRTATA